MKVAARIGEGLRREIGRGRRRRPKRQKAQAARVGDGSDRGDGSLLLIVVPYTNSLALPLPTQVGYR